MIPAESTSTVEEPDASTTPASHEREGTPDITDDEREVRSLLARGDARRAIAMCTRTVGPSIGRLCFAMLGVQAEADEALQETLLAAYDGASSFRGEGSVRGWLYGIARRVCARRVEIRTRRARRQPILDASSDEASAPADELLEAARRGARVRSALEALRPTEREALLLRYEADLSFREVAEACGIAEAAARQRVGRALAKLKERLGEGTAIRFEKKRDSPRRHGGETRREMKQEGQKIRR
jgi:RNA polymerase sigma-70 factor (ECF subfamily)